jgi:hypothetical protein
MSRDNATESRDIGECPKKRALFFLRSVTLELVFPVPEFDGRRALHFCGLWCAARCVLASLAPGQNDVWRKVHKEKAEAYAVFTSAWSDTGPGADRTPTDDPSRLSSLANLSQTRDVLHIGEHSCRVQEEAATCGISEPVLIINSFL